MLNDANLFLFLVSLVLVLVGALLIFSVVIAHLHTQSQKERQNIMKELDNLKAAVSGLEVSVSDGFAAQQSALTELLDDVAKLPQLDPAELQAEVDRILAAGGQINSATASFSQAVRDALPTESVPNPNPDPQPDGDAEEDGDSEEPTGDGEGTEGDESGSGEENPE